METTSRKVKSNSVVTRALNTVHNIIKSEANQSIDKSAWTRSNTNARIVSSKEEQENFVESLYSNYKELQAQNEEIDEEKRKMEYDVFRSRQEEIHNLLFANLEVEGEHLGDWDTWEQVENIVRKYAYGRSTLEASEDNVDHKLMLKSIYALQERLETFSNVVAAQQRRIASLQESVTPLQEELQGLLSILHIKENDIRSLFAKNRSLHLQLRQAERECAFLRGVHTDKSTCEGVFEDIRLLIQANKMLEEENARLKLICEVKEAVVVKKDLESFRETTPRCSNIFDCHNNTLNNDTLMNYLEDDSKRWRCIEETIPESAAIMHIFKSEEEWKHKLEYEVNNTLSLLDVDANWKTTDWFSCAWRSGVTAENTSYRNAHDESFINFGVRESEKAILPIDLSNITTSIAPVHVIKVQNLQTYQPCTAEITATNLNKEDENFNKDNTQEFNFISKTASKYNYGDNKNVKNIDDNNDDTNDDSNNNNDNGSSDWYLQEEKEKISLTKRSQMRSSKKRNTNSEKNKDHNNKGKTKHITRHKSSPLEEEEQQQQQLRQEEEEYEEEEEEEHVKVSKRTQSKETAVKTGNETSEILLASLSHTPLALSTNKKLNLVSDRNKNKLVSGDEQEKNDTTTILSTRKEFVSHESNWSKIRSAILQLGISSRAECLRREVCHVVHWRRCIEFLYIQLESIAKLLHHSPLLRAELPATTVHFLTSLIPFDKKSLTRTDKSENKITKLEENNNTSASTIATTTITKVLPERKITNELELAISCVTKKQCNREELEQHTYNITMETENLTTTTTTTTTAAVAVAATEESSAVEIGHEKNKYDACHPTHKNNVTEQCELIHRCYENDPLLKVQSYPNEQKSFQNQPVNKNVDCASDNFFVEREEKIEQSESSSSWCLSEVKEIKEYEHAPGNDIKIAISPLNGHLESTQIFIAADDKVDSALSIHNSNNLEHYHHNNNNDNNNYSSTKKECGKYKLVSSSTTASAPQMAEHIQNMQRQVMQLRYCLEKMHKDVMEFVATVKCHKLCERHGSLITKGEPFSEKLTTEEIIATRPAENEENTICTDLMRLHKFLDNEPHLDTVVDDSSNSKSSNNDNINTNIKNKNEKNNNNNNNAHLESSNNDSNYSPLSVELEHYIRQIEQKVRYEIIENVQKELIEALTNERIENVLENEYGILLPQKRLITERSSNEEWLTQRLRDIIFKEITNQIHETSSNKDNENLLKAACSNNHSNIENTKVSNANTSFLPSNTLESVYRVEAKKHSRTMLETMMLKNNTDTNYKDELHWEESEKRNNLAAVLSLKEKTDDIQKENLIKELYKCLNIVNFEEENRIKPYNKIAGINRKNEAKESIYRGKESFYSREDGKFQSIPCLEGSKETSQHDVLNTQDNVEREVHSDDDKIVNSLIEGEHVYSMNKEPVVPMQYSYLTGDVNTTCTSYERLHCTSPQEVNTIKPVVLHYELPSLREVARTCTKRVFTNLQEKMRAKDFTSFLQIYILPIAAFAAKVASNGSYLNPTMRLAVSELRAKEEQRRKERVKLIFQRVATNIRTRRLLKQDVHHGSAFLSYVSLLYKRWKYHHDESEQVLKKEETTEQLKLMKIINSEHSHFHLPNVNNSISSIGLCNDKLNLITSFTSRNSNDQLVSKQGEKYSKSGLTLTNDSAIKQGDEHGKSSYHFRDVILPRI